MRKGFGIGYGYGYENVYKNQIYYPKTAPKAFLPSGKAHTITDNRNTSI